MLLPKAKNLFSLRWSLLTPIPLLWCILSANGWLDFVESKFTDWRYQFRGELPTPLKVVYVDVDSQSIDEIGGFPWSRMYFARVAEALIAQGGVRAVGFDFVLSDNGVSESVDRTKYVTGNRAFARYLWKNPPVVLAASYSAAVFRDINGRKQQREFPLLTNGLGPTEQLESPELPAFNVGQNTPWNPPNVGLIDTIDGGTRWVPLFAPSGVRTYYHLSLELARLYFGLGPDAIQVAGNTLELVRPDGSVVSHLPLKNGQLLEVNWFSAWLAPENNPRIGFSTVYNYAEMLKSEDGTERISAEKFFAQPDWKDAVVLIGPTDPLLQDLATTPFDSVPVPKVGVHGNLLKTIVSGKFITHLSQTAIYGVIFGLTLFVTGMVIAGGGRGVFTKIMAVLAAAIYVAGAFQLFREMHVLLPMTGPLGAAFTTSFGALIWQVLEEQKQKGRIKGMFGAYVSPELVSRMVESGEDPQLGGHDAEITAYFSDIQSFSTFSEVLGSGPLVDLMNEYLTACTDIVQEEGGTLDKYIGDAVVAMFGAPIPAPDHAYRACVATQRVHQKLAELRTKWKDEGEKWPEIVKQMQTRIGLNTGMCMIGNMGSRTRFNYTMMGDNVNLAARMESGAKSWGSYTMCTEVTKNSCEKHGGDRLVFRRLGRIVVKGRSQAVPIFEIVGLKENVSEATMECIRIFEQGLDQHYALDWDGAQASFERSREIEPNLPGVTPGVTKNPSLVYLDIVAKYRINPPPSDWDGVHVMTEK
ncbi:MAG: adenylate/guanylate cyclase domain-containing protein [Cephaloticoccus sp.]|nr:adenylate/guanylate cyclase domain-containing protein [Cephaloticoccus sp.]